MTIIALCGCSDMPTTFTGLLLDREKAPPSVARIPDKSTDRELGYGTARGFIAENGNRLWLGIPYAGSVSGEHRWTLPSPPEPWSGVREMVNDPERCLQVGLPQEQRPAKGYFGVEDCLTLDVVIPESAAQGNQRLPVMVWIHGGGNSLGAPGDLTRNRLVSEGNVILVGVRYRLGPLGWLSLPALREAGIPTSNFGTEDIIAALKWVQATIGIFNGDPANVTVFGESAGGLNIASLMLSPRAKGLFHKAIMQSAAVTTTNRSEAENSETALQPGLRNNSTDIVRKVLDEQCSAGITAACENPTGDKLLAVLRDVAPMDIIKHYPRSERDTMYAFPNRIRDGYTIPDMPPRDIIRQGSDFNSVPVIMGNNRDELKGLLLFTSGLAEKSLFGLPKVHDMTTFNRLSQYISLSWKYGGIDQPASWIFNAGNHDVYLYRFDWDEEPSILGSDFAQLIGAAHALDVPFVMGQFHGHTTNPHFLTADNAEGRHELSRNMRHYWTNFARYGTPNRSGSNMPEWKPWRPDPQLPDAMVFDTSSDGGVRMETLRVSKASVSTQMFEDPLVSVKARCDIVALMHIIDIWTEKDLQNAGLDACPGS